MRQEDEAFPSSSLPGPLPGQPATMDRPINLVKVFSATKSRDRERLGERVTDWIAANPTVEVVRTSITQTSDHAFHCLSFVLFCAAAAA